MKTLFIAVTLTLTSNAWSSQNNVKELMAFAADNYETLDKMDLEKIKTSEEFIRRVRSGEFDEFLKKAKKLEEKARVCAICWD
ncbi:MAG: hypothetical protein ACO20H_13820 [Bacteriovoracaceae bacterium]